MIRRIRRMGYADCETYISIAFAPSLRSASAVNPGGPTATKAPFAWCPSRNPVCSGSEKCYGVVLALQLITYCHDPMCNTDVISTGLSLNEVHSGADYSPDDVDADVEEGHEEPEALMREQFSYMFQGLQVGS